MGSSSSTAFDYQGQLFADNVQVSRERKNCPEEKNASKPRVDMFLVPADESLRHIPTFGDGKITTLWESFEYGATRNGERTMLGTRPFLEDGKSRGPYVFQTYSQVHTMAKQVGSGLVSLEHKRHDNIGIFAENRAEWVISQLGIFSQAMRVVSLYATLGDKAVDYILNHAEIATCMVSKENLKHLMKSLPHVSHRASGGYLKTIVQFDENKLFNNTKDSVEEADIAACQQHGVTLISFSALMAAGSAATPNPPVPEDWAFIMYTSGTTGVPKGAILSHSNLIATLGSTDARFTLSHTDRHVSYLPLAHIFETVVEQAMFANGGTVGFFSGDIKMLTSDQKELRPTLWCGVPRVFDKVFKTVMAGAEEGGCAKNMVFSRALAVSTECCRRSWNERDALYDSKVWLPARRDKLGLDQVRYIITGAAPCPPYLMEFLRVLIGCPVIQGYGMTETSAAATIMAQTDITTGHNGAPLPCNEIKLVDVEEMNYLHTDSPHPRGEVWVRGPNIFKGYFKNEKATSEDLTSDGWLKTGDVGRWNPNGTLSIIDRKKNIFKLSQGEYIAAEKCEQVYGKSTMCAQMFLYGNSYKSFVVAIVVPSAVALHLWLKEQGWWPEIPADMQDIKVYSTTEAFRTTFHTVCQAHVPEVKQKIMAELDTESKSLKSFEKVKDIWVETQLDAALAGFTEANECLTPTFKLRRPFCLKRYLSQLQAMYNANGEPCQPDEHWPGV